MTYDLSSLAAAFRTNFRTIHFPPSKEPCPQSPGHLDWLQAAKAGRADHLAVQDYCRRLRRELIAYGHRRFLTHAEPDPDGGWRLHIFVADDDAMSLLDEITGGRCGLGDPASFDPEAFILTQLEEWCE